MMGLDVGRKRIGIAVCDESELIATPKQTLTRSGTIKDVAKLVELAQRESVEKFVVGLPLSLDGTMGSQANFVAQFAEALRDGSRLPVEMMDERFSSVEADEAMLEHGLNGKTRRKLVDKIAASMILQRYLDREQPSADSAQDFREP